MRQPFPRKKYPGRILLGCTSSGMPGSYWSALVAIVPRAKGTQIWASPDAAEYPPALVATLPGAFSLRKVVEFLADDEATQCAGDFLGEAHVDGAKGVWGELLLLAWMHDDEVGLNRVARAAVALSDRDLRALRKEVRGFDSLAAEEIAEVIRIAEEDLGLEGPTLADLGKRAGVKPFNLKAVRTFLKRAARRQRAKDARAAKAAKALEEERQVRLAPWRQSIDEAVTRWGVANNAAGSSMYIAFRWRPVLGRIRSFMEEHALQFGSLPEGVHDLGEVRGPSPQSGREGQMLAVGKVDFTSLLSNQ